MDINVLASDVPLMIKVLSDVIPSVLLEPVSVLIEVTNGVIGAVVSIITESSALTPIFPISSVTNAVTVKVFPSPGLVKLVVIWPALMWAAVKIKVEPLIVNTSFSSASIGKSIVTSINPDNSKLFKLTS